LGWSSKPRDLVRRKSNDPFAVIERKPLTQISNESMIQALNELKHEVLSHQVFLSCFASAVREGEIKGLTKSSLFRMTLAYFLLVPDAKDKFLTELEKQLKRKTGS